MSSMAQVMTSLRSLRLSNIGEALEKLIAQAEANELTYLQCKRSVIDVSRLLRRCARHQILFQQHRINVPGHQFI